MQVSIHEAKTNLSKLIQSALHGEEVIIAKGKSPVVKLTPLAVGYPDRNLGGAKGIIQEMPDNFNDEIDDFDEL